MKIGIKNIGLAVLAMVLFSSCGNKGSETPTPATKVKSENVGGLSDFEIEHGIGPIKKEITLGELDMPLAEKGAEIFELNCSACHQKSERYIGPALGDVLDKRSPTYVMNMILNPDGMVKEHPEVKALLAEYLAPMPNQNLSVEEARAIVEYFNSEIE